MHWQIICKMAQIYAIRYWYHMQNGDLNSKKKFVNIENREYIIISL